MKTYSEFIDVVNSKVALYVQIPEKHLTCEGSIVRDLYKAVLFNTGFASNATELLALLNEDDDVEFYANHAVFEYSKIHRCLERLAASENEQTN